MSSRRKEWQEDTRLRLMRVVSQNPKATTREIAQKIGISNGSAYYLLTSLIDKGLIKLSNFNNNSQKTIYLYFLTPKGIREKSKLTHAFLIRKKKEYKLLKEELIELEQDVGIYKEECDEK